MICKIYDTKETDNLDGIYDDCKYCIVDDKIFRRIIRIFINSRLTSVI